MPFDSSGQASPPAPMDVGHGASSTSAFGNDPTAALLHSAARGCRASFRSLYAQTSGRLFGIIVRINNDRGEAEEVLQETYLKIWHQCDGYDASKGPAVYWLASIARNTAIDSMRRANNRPKRSAHLLGDDEDQYAGLHSPMAQPLDDLIARRRSAAVQRCLSDLPPEQRESMTLAYYNGMSHEEIAHRLGRPLGTVKSWLRRSLLSMRDALDAER